MQDDSTPSMDQARSPGILKRDKMLCSSKFGVTSYPLADMQVGPSFPSQPQPSASRQSVTFAIVECQSDEDSVGEKNPKSQTVATERAKTRFHDDMQHVSIAATSKRVELSDILQNRVSMEKSNEDGEGNVNEDDYSASVCAIMQRRNSTRRQNRRKRRPSSPFSVDVDNVMRRRSSAYTISSGDTIISMEESGNQEQIFENLKLHKEVLSGVKQQPWPLRRKIKLVRQAKAYVRRHEGALHERLAQSRSTKDIIARISLFMTKKWQYFRRELINLQTWLIPWQVRIMEIESHFGSAVASYFLFLRWLFWINFVIAVILTAFVVIPGILSANEMLVGDRKIMLEEGSTRNKSNHLLTLWEFEEILKYSPLFYGWYTNQGTNSNYILPLAYFITNLVVYTYSFVAILRKMAKNSRLSKLTEKKDEYVFSWKLFTGWDFMIGNPETSYNRTASIVLGFKEVLLEEAEKQKDERNWKIISMRIFVNIAVLSLLALSAFAVFYVVQRSTTDLHSWWRQNEITIVMSLITYLFPIFFEILGFLESYHPRKQLRIQLARIMVLNLLNLYTLIFALFHNIDNMQNGLKPTNTTCTYKLMPKCGDELTRTQQITTLASLSLLVSNITHFHAKREILGPTLPSVTENTIYLNPILEYEELNNTSDDYDYSNLNYDDNEYEIFNASSNDELNTTFYYEEQDTQNMSNSVTHYDASSTVTADFLTDSTTVEDFYTNFISSENETVASTTKLSTMEESSGASDISDFTEATEISNFTETIASASLFPDNETTDISDFTETIEISNFTETIAVASSFPDNETTDISDFTETTTIASSFPDNKATPIKEFSDTSTTIDVTSTTIITYIPENSVPTVSSNERVTPPLKKNYVVECYERICITTPVSVENLVISIKELDMENRTKLSRSCWETMFGQELVKLTVMDLILTILATLNMDFFRAVFVRYMNNCWCWDLEKQFPQYGDFKIAENILHLVYNQGMVWMGMFFSPGLTVLNLFKLGILMYLRSWAVLTCNVPHEVIFRASRSNNFYFALLLTMLFLCVLPVGYAIVWVEPSWHCGPFSHYKRMYSATQRLLDALPEPVRRGLNYVASPSTIIPLIVLMTLIIYYMVSLTGSLREANNDLKVQLRHERTEERRKLFKIAEKRQGVGDTPLSRWKKILPALPQARIGISRNSEITQGDDVQIAIDNLSDTVKKIQLNDNEEDSLHHDQMAHCNNEKRKEQEDELRLNNTSSRKRPISFVGSSWDSQSSGQSVIPEIQENDEEKAVCSDTHGSVDLTNDPEDCN